MQMKRLVRGITPIFVVILMSVSAIALSSGPDDDHGRASIQWDPPADTKVWNATENSNADLAGNWKPIGIPSSGDDIIFNGTSTFDCIWDLEIADLGNFSINAGYTGTVTQSVDFGVLNYMQNGADSVFDMNGDVSTGNFSLDVGVFTGHVGYTLTCSGNFADAGGALMHNIVLLTGAGKTADIRGNLYHLQVTGTYTTAGAFQTYRLNNTGTITITTGQHVRIICYFGDTSTHWEGNGTIQGAAGTYVNFDLYDYDRTITFSQTVTCDVRVNAYAGSPSNRVLTLGENTSFGGDLTVGSSHATYTMELNHGTNFTLGVTGAVTLGARGLMTQGTGAWSFGSYSQTGVSSVFNQGAALTIGGDFTVSAGVFNAIGDMTVPGDWDTETGSYLNDDNAIFLTGASKTLVMNAVDSFYNLTVSGDYTMDTDITIRLRATISGTVDGTGNFIEPFPEFTSIPVLDCTPLKLYEYDITQTYWDILAIHEAPYWLVLVDDTLTGVPKENDSGVFIISLNLTWNNMTTYHNYTISVSYGPGDSISPLVIISLALGFGALALAVVQWPFMFLAGLIFIGAGLFLFIPYGAWVTILSLGFGMMLLAEGGVKASEG